MLKSRILVVVLAVVALLLVGVASVSAQGGDLRYAGFMATDYAWGPSETARGLGGTGYGSIQYHEASDGSKAWFGNFYFMGLKHGETYSIKSGAVTLCSFTARDGNGMIGAGRCTWPDTPSVPGITPFVLTTTPTGVSLTCTTVTPSSVVDSAGNTLPLSRRTLGQQGGYHGVGCF